jgi:hypothetical protein
MPPLSGLAALAPQHREHRGDVVDNFPPTHPLHQPAFERASQCRSVTLGGREFWNASPRNRTRAYAFARLSIRTARLWSSQRRSSPGRCRPRSHIAADPVSSDSCRRRRQTAFGDMNLASKRLPDESSDRCSVCNSAAGEPTFVRPRSGNRTAEEIPVFFSRASIRAPPSRCRTGCPAPAC